MEKLLAELKSEFEELRGNVAKSNKQRVEALSVKIEQLEQMYLTEKQSKIPETPTTLNPLSGEYAYEDFSPLDVIESIIRNLALAEKLHTQAQEEIGVFDREVLDLLHAIELFDLTDEELIKLTLRLKETRELRRTIKNFLELNQPLRDLNSKSNAFVTAAIRAKQSIGGKVKSLGKRKYRVRECHDLQPLFDKYQLGIPVNGVEGVNTSDDSNEGDDQQSYISEGEETIFNDSYASDEAEGSENQNNQGSPPLNTSADYPTAMALAMSKVNIGAIAQ